MVTPELIDSGAAQPRRDCSDAGLSPADEAAIARYAGDADELFGRAMHLLPSSRRWAMEALYVFCRELGNIAQDQASRTLNLALLVDWRAEIARLYAGRLQHFSMRALRDAIERCDLRCDDFLAIIAGTEMDVRSDIRAPVLVELDLYCERSNGGGLPHRIPHLGRSAACQRAGGGGARPRHAACRHTTRPDPRRGTAAPLSAA
jgi:hypothetical protein